MMMDLMVVLPLNVKGRWFYSPLSEIVIARLNISLAIYHPSPEYCLGSAECSYGPLHLLWSCECDWTLHSHWWSSWWLLYIGHCWKGFLQWCPHVDVINFQPPQPSSFSEVWHKPLGCFTFDADWFQIYLDVLMLSRVSHCIASVEFSSLDLGPSIWWSLDLSGPGATNAGEKCVGYWRALESTVDVTLCPMAEDWEYTGW